MATLSPITNCASFPSLSGTRNSIKLPEFKGLKLRPSCLTRSLKSLSSRRINTRTLSIACEAQDTTVDGGACGYDNTIHAGFGINTAAVSSALFRGGEACGACYQVLCNYKLDPKWCLRRRTVILTATNFCPPNNNGGWCDPPRQHFDMSMPAFFRIARQGNEGIIPVLYKRVPCKRSGGIHFTMRGQSNFNMVMISNVGGSGDVKAAWIKGSRTRNWAPMHRNWGANWQGGADLRNQNLSFKLTLVDGRTLEFFNVVPSTWKFGQTFASENQFY